MDRLRRSLRESFRRKKEHVPECSKPHQWQADEAAVRSGTCSFSVKYLGCVEVFESRGMQVCEEALKVLRNSRRRPVKGILYVTGDGLRVVEDETKGLIVDQTIEKVSFCAPDRNHDKGFSYICRDGTTRRWMCHGFLAMKDSGERLSHAVGCAFAACLERKQKRDKECGVTMTFDPNNATFTRTGSFRQTSLTDRMQDPQDCKPAEPPPVKAVHNPYAIERPHATPMMLQRQGSFRGFSHLASPQLPSRVPRNRLHSLPNAVNMSPILENAPVVDKQESISALCQQVTQGLTLLSNAEDPFVTSQSQRYKQQGRIHETFNYPNSSTTQTVPQMVAPTNSTVSQYNDQSKITEKYPYASQNSYSTANNISYQNQLNQQNLSGQTYTVSSIMGTNYITNTSSAVSSKPFHATENAHQTNPWLNTDTGSEIAKSSAAEEWLASAGSIPRSSSNPSDLVVGQIHAPAQDPTLLRRAPNLVHLRSQSLGEGQTPRTEPWSNGTIHDPFDAEWAALATRSQTSTNPFQQNSMKVFEVQL